jgi:hypothetical protein
LVQHNNNPFTTTTTTNNITTTTTTNNITTTTTTENYTTTTTTENYTTTTTTVCDVCDVPRGFYATKFEVLVQKTLNGVRPNPSQWRIIDFTDQIDEMFINGYITEESLISTTFVVSSENYDQAPIYNLNDYIQLTEIGDNESQLNFGDEYYFYGNLETDIQATIYEMKYKVNLSSSEFLVSQNPTWTPGTPSYVSEIALLNENQDILVMSKLQSPVLRQGIQQYVVKLDF